MTGSPHTILAITPLDELSFAELQRGVQLKLGRGMYHLQQYELQLKALVGHSELYGPACWTFERGMLQALRLKLWDR